MIDNLMVCMVTQERMGSTLHQNFQLKKHCQSFAHADSPQLVSLAVVFVSSRTGRSVVCETKTSAWETGDSIVPYTAVPEIWASPFPKP